MQNKENAESGIFWARSKILPFACRLYRFAVLKCEGKPHLCFRSENYILYIHFIYIERVLNSVRLFITFFIVCINRILAQLYIYEKVAKFTDCIFYVNEIELQINVPPFLKQRVNMYCENLL